MTADLVVIRETTLRDVPGTLRRLADAVEAGEYGTPTGCAVVLDADRISVSYMGDGEALASAHLLLCAGAADVLRRATGGRG